MKKLLVLIACFSAVYGEPQVENAGKIVSLSEAALPASEAPQAVILQPQVELDTEAPDLEETVVTTQIDVNTPAKVIEELFIENPAEEIAALEKEEKEVAAAVKSAGIVIDLSQVFAGSPTIYTLLIILSISCIAIWSYTLYYLRTPEQLPAESLKEIREKLIAKNFNEALAVCEKKPTILFKMVATAIVNRGQTSTIIADQMKAEGRRASVSLWQKISLLNDIAVIAPMLGLLGTVLGMFYAFYDLNRSMESISALFDGLGISVGTTLGGLVVAILALLFHAISKYRLTRQLNQIENEAQAIVCLIDKGSP